ncbi:DUF305 domain-containing protein [Glycomyces tenuis]|uniref:DUF305 domain-containing protein n=1 Tax=Glycomyces tenuis TaxID=58116 RepID=UPI0003F85C20|nr:DUF305 domain-containing protein [Glycomyces tenuis]
MTTTFTMRRALFAGIATFAALAFAAGCGEDTGNSDNATDAETSTATDVEFNDADVAFAQMMIPHHEQAVEMAELAQQHAADPEIKSLADQIISSQGEEIATMTAMLDEWGAPVEMEGHGDMNMGGMATEDQMAELEAARGAEFDRLFVELMIAHHQGAIDMAETELAEGQNPEALALAEEIVEAQTAEITTLEEIQAQL